MTDRHKIIMNFSAPPALEDIEVLVQEALVNLPSELTNFCEELAAAVEDVPDETVAAELELESVYDLVALYRSAGEISPGVKKKVANDDDTLVIFRRPLLDLWCETGEDLAALVQQVVIEELGRNFDFSEEEIDLMTRNIA